MALARALAVKPRLLLLDEPLSALNSMVRTELHGEIRELQQRLGILTIAVTHDQEEALTSTGRIIRMRQGRIVQIGELDTLCHGPANRFVDDFMGVSISSTRIRCARMPSR